MLGAFLRNLRVSAAKEKAMDILEIVGMADKANVMAEDITLAGQRRLEIARAIATEPRLVLLDESMAGLTPVETMEVMELIRRLGETGIAFLIVEHVMPIIMNLAERIIVMQAGKKIAEDKPDRIVKNKQVIEAYLGEEEVLSA